MFVIRSSQRCGLHPSLQEALPPDFVTYHRVLRLRGTPPHAAVCTLVCQCLHCIASRSTPRPLSGYSSISLHSGLGFFLPIQEPIRLFALSLFFLLVVLVQIEFYLPALSNIIVHSGHEMPYLVRELIRLCTHSSRFALLFLWHVQTSRLQDAQSIMKLQMAMHTLEFETVEQERVARLLWLIMAAVAIGQGGGLRVVALVHLRTSVKLECVCVCVFAS